MSISPYDEDKFESPEQREDREDYETEQALEREEYERNYTDRFTGGIY